LGGLHDTVVEVDFVVPGALPQLLEHRTRGIGQQCLTNVLVRLLYDGQAGLDLGARAGFEQRQAFSKSLLPATRAP
jgi:hypothetical protein